MSAAPSDVEKLKAQISVLQKLLAYGRLDADVIEHQLAQRRAELRQHYRTLSTSRGTP